MKTAYFDQDFYLNDPNLYLGNPSYLLEPGDAGYVDPFPAVNPPTRKKKPMKHNNYFPMAQGNQIIWLQTFSGKIPTHATELSLATGVATAAAADCLWVVYLLEQWLPAVRQWAQSCTDVLMAAETGAGSGAITLPTFTAPALTNNVTAQAPGSLNRIFTLVQSIKDSGKCTDAIATDLGIVGTENVTPNLAVIQPPLSAVLNGDHVDIKSGWGGQGKSLDSMELQKDWGDGKGFVYLATLTGVTFKDTAHLPAARTVWTYRIIYRVANQQIGQWSNSVAVAVGG
jgi:hypothetical protein